MMVMTMMSLLSELFGLDEWVSVFNFIGSYLVSMGVEISYSKSYFRLDAWVLANVVQLATQSFCRRFVSFHDDPRRRLFDQMVMAARSAVANIAEGSARHNTSIETEMRLTDVARASVDELFGDYFNFLMSRNLSVWIRIASIPGQCGGW